SVILLLLIIYLFSILFSDAYLTTMTMPSDPPVNVDELRNFFGSLQISMFTLLVLAACNVILEHGWLGVDFPLHSVARAESASSVKASAPATAFAGTVAVPSHTFVAGTPGKHVRWVSAWAKCGCSRTCAKSYRVDMGALEERVFRATLVEHGEHPESSTTEFDRARWHRAQAVARASIAAARALTGRRGHGRAHANRAGARCHKNTALVELQKRRLQVMFLPNLRLSLKDSVCVEFALSWIPEYTRMKKTCDSSSPGHPATKSQKGSTSPEVTPASRDAKSNVLVSAVLVAVSVFLVAVNSCRCRNIGLVVVSRSWSNAQECEVGCGAPARRSQRCGGGRLTSNTPELHVFFFAMKIGHDGGLLDFTRKPFCVVRAHLGVVFCHSAIAGAEQDHEFMVQSMVGEQERIRTVFCELFQMMDHDESGMITIKEFEHGFKVESTRAWFEALGIKAEDAWTIFRSLDRDGDHRIGISEFVEGCINIRGPAREVDLMRQSQRTHQQLQAVEGTLVDSLVLLKDVAAQLIDTSESIRASQSH
ncbi:Scn8a, partial [Symbiodinium sp. CCMP2456]